MHPLNDLPDFTDSYDSLVLAGHEDPSPAWLRRHGIDPTEYHAEPEPPYDGSLPAWRYPDNAKLVTSPEQLYRLAGPGAIVQPKWDGHRVVVHIGGADGDEITAYSRKHNARDLPEPVLDALDARPEVTGVLLDGELMGSHRQRGTAPLYVVFDCLYSDGHWLGQWPYTARLDLVRELVNPCDHNYVRAIDTLAEFDIDDALTDSRVEGLVTKRPGSFLVGGRDRAAVNPGWFKWRAR